MKLGAPFQESKAALRRGLGRFAYHRLQLEGVSKIRKGGVAEIAFRHKTRRPRSLANFELHASVLPPWLCGGRQGYARLSGESHSEKLRGMRYGAVEYLPKLRGMADLVVSEHMVEGDIE